MPDTLNSIYAASSSSLLSDDVQEIINYRPHWFIRKGNLIFLLVIALLIGLASLIRYPDAISASVRLASLETPKMLEARAAVKLEKLLVKDGDYVKADQPLAYLHSTGRHESVFYLRDWITEAELKIEAGKTETIFAGSLPPLKDLGELQAAYQDFQATLKETQQLKAGGYYQRKKDALQKDLQYISVLKNNANEQKQLIARDQDLQKKEYAAYEQLEKEKVIAPLELNQYKSKLIAKEQDLGQAASQLTTNEISSHNKRKELLELQKVVDDLQTAFQSSLFNLKSKVKEWIQQYVVVAPEAGRLEFVSFLQENQLLSMGQHLFFIQPPQSGYFAEMKAGQTGFGKIKAGQKVILRFDSYPDAEFGHVNGTVSSISSLPNQRDSFLVKVELPDGLRTTYGKTIFFRNNLSGSAKIITDERRLIHRFFGQFRQLTNR